ncbi:Putative serine proteinase stubble [Gryllus bimaculatus]|nr:Putative serine proteinase stubble [Gryllus bimaculatus]
MKNKTPVKGYHIRPRPCAAAGSDGTCMFVWECLRAGGKPLGVCVDHFMFGSCCGDAPEDDSDEDDDEDEDGAEPEDNAVEDTDELLRPLAPAPALAVAMHGSSAAPHHQHTAGSTPAAMWVRPPPPPPPRPGAPLVALLLLCSSLRCRRRRDWSSTRVCRGGSYVVFVWCLDGFRSVWIVFSGGIATGRRFWAGVGAASSVRPWRGLAD